MIRLKPNSESYFPNAVEFKCNCGEVLEFYEAGVNNGGTSDEQECFCCGKKLDVTVFIEVDVEVEER